MNDTRDIVEVDPPEPVQKDEVAVGQWYWVKDVEVSYEGDEHIETPTKWLGCITHVGTNYALLKAVGGGTERIHFDHFWTRCERESRPEQVIEQQIDRYQTKTRELMAEVVEVSRRLVLSTAPTIPETAPANALVVLSGAPNVDEYKSALVKAKKDELPALFKAIESSNEWLVTWMKARSIPLKANVDGLGGILAAVDARIFNVELYAGLVARKAERDAKTAVRRAEDRERAKRNAARDEKAADIKARYLAELEAYAEQAEALDVLNGRRNGDRGA